MALFYHRGGVEVFELSCRSAPTDPIRTLPCKGVVFHSTISPYCLVLIAGLNDPLPNIDGSSDGQEKAVLTGVVLFDELSRSQLARTNGLVAWTRPLVRSSIRYPTSSLSNLANSPPIRMPANCSRRCGVHRMYLIMLWSFPTGPRARHIPSRILFRDTFESS